MGAIATETRYPRDVHLSLNFRHDLATKQASKRAKVGHDPTQLVSVWSATMPAVSLTPGSSKKRSLSA
jgi:hypothetical protein